MTEDRNQTGMFAGKISLVTGAASGLGRALARTGSNLVVVDVNEAGLKETACLIGQERRQCLVKKADVSDRQAMVIVAGGNAHTLPSRCVSASASEAMARTAPCGLLRIPQASPLISAKFLTGSQCEPDATSCW